MRIFLLSADLEVLFLGALYFQQGFEVCVSPRLKLPTRLRIITPYGWFSIKLTESSRLENDDLVLAGSGALSDIDKLAGRIERICWINVDPEVFDYKLKGDWYYLLNELSLIDDDVLELHSSSFLYCLKRLKDKRNIKILRKSRLNIQFTDNRNSLYYTAFLYHLLYLPAALCGISVEHFLSYPEGRKIARKVLQEGRKCLEKMSVSVKKIPLKDSNLILKNIELKDVVYNNNRYLPGRKINPLLSAVFKNQQVPIQAFTGHFLIMAKENAVEASWNMRLEQRLNRVMCYDFFKDPAALLSHIS